MATLSLKKEISQETIDRLNGLKKVQVVETKPKAKPMPKVETPEVKVEPIETVEAKPETKVETAEVKAEAAKPKKKKKKRNWKVRVPTPGYLLFKEIAGWCEKTFPNAFNFKNPKPLKVGITKDILLIGTPYDEDEFKKFMKGYCLRKDYFKSLVENDYRYDLKGEKAGEVEEASKKHAERQVEAKYKKWQSLMGDKKWKSLMEDKCNDPVE